MSAPFQLGTVGHFMLLVPDPRRSADWYIANLGMREAFEFDDIVAVESDGVTIVLRKGVATPQSFGHMSFHLPDMKTLRAALAYLRERHVSLEDPGDEIGAEAEDSPNIGLWLRDPDGYRFELNVQGGANEK